MERYTYPSSHLANGDAMKQIFGLMIRNVTETVRAARASVSITAPSAKEKSNGEQDMNEDIANILGLVIENMNENYQLPDPNLLVHYEN